MENPKDGIIKPSLASQISNAIGFAAIHVACILAIWTGVTWRAVAIAYVLYWTRMFLITGGYHRYFAHRSYKTSRWFQFVLAFLGTTAIQKGPIYWSSLHVVHHRYSDWSPKDVHSPRQHGLWYAHIGWLLFNNKHNTTDMRHVKDWAKYPELMWLEKYHWVAPVLLTFLCYWLGGWSGMIVGMGWSTVILWHVVFSINSLAHVWGSKRYETGDDSRNNPILAVATMGEGWHNNHHHCQLSAKQGFKWWEIDTTYYTLQLLAKFGIIWDLKKPSEKVLTSKLVNTNQLSAP